jgi:hypothetical protein
MHECPSVHPVPAPLPPPPPPVLPRNSGFVAFERREDAEKALHALSDSQVEGRSLKLMWAKAVKVSAGASGTTGTAVIVSKDLILDQKGVLGRTGKRGGAAP